MIKKISILSLCLLFMFACEEQNEDTTQQTNKDGSIVSTISTKHLNDSADVAIFSIQYYKNGQLVKSSNVFDTIPSLGKTTETVENDEGDEKEVKLPKEYVIYVTLK